MVLADHLLSIRSEYDHSSHELQHRDFDSTMELEQANITRAPDLQPVVLVEHNSLMRRPPFLLPIVAIISILQL